MAEAAATNAILAANQAFYAAFRARDFEAMTAAWAAERPISCIHPGWRALHGRHAVLSSFRAILDNPAAPEVHCDGEQLSLLGDVALVVCIEHVFDAALVATNVFALERGAWRLVHHQAGPFEGGRGQSAGRGARQRDLN